MPCAARPPRTSGYQPWITALLLATGVAGGDLAAQTATPAAAPTSADSVAVRSVLEGYFRGQATGDGSHFRAVFQPTANLYWIREGRYTERTSADWMAAASGGPAADEAQRRRRIEAMDVTGDAAIAKLVSEYPTATVTDYMTLLKTEAGWRIVSKTFTVQPRPR